VELTSLFTTTSFFKYIFPPAFYAFHGWIATEMAIWALFHPYDAWYFPGTKIAIPCTPGIFPKGRAKLAQAVAQTITDTLLTTEDIKAQAEQLVTQENLYRAIDLFFDAILKEFRDTTKLHRLAQDIAELSPAVLEQLIVSIIDAVESGKDQRVAIVTEKIFDQVVLSARISLDQANDIAARVMETVVTPQHLRQAIISLLSPQNIVALDESIQAHASGPYRLLARIIGVKRVCYEWRNFIEKEPEEADRILAELTKRFGIKDQIALQIANFDLRSLPLQTIAHIKQSVINFVEAFILERKVDILDSVKRIENEAMSTVRSAIVRFNPESIPRDWLDRAKRDTASFCYSYLQRELGELLEKAIPQLGMYSLIARKIDLFTPRQLEEIIRRLCKTELKWLAYLGGFIGGWLGLVQIAVNVAFY
jgi:uncharacterized membrane protein YheB (UPF0754 family)